MIPPDVFFDELMALLHPFLTPPPFFPFSLITNGGTPEALSAWRVSFYLLFVPMATSGRHP